MTAVGAAVNDRNPNEAKRQVTRQALIALLRHGIRATINAGTPMHPAVRGTVRLVGQLLGEEVAALPAHSADTPLTSQDADDGRS